MTLLQQIMPMPIPIYTDSTPLTKEQGNAMLGVWILLHIVAVIWVVVRTAQWLILWQKYQRDKIQPYGYNTWVDQMLNPLFGTLFLGCLALIDGIVILLKIGYWIGNTLLKK